MQMEQDLLNKDPKLDAFVATGGFGEFLVDAYKNSMGQFKDKIAKRSRSPSRSRTRCRCSSTT